MRIPRKEPTIDELLADPMMEPVLNYSRTTADEVRSLMSDVAGRLATSREECCGASADERTVVGD
jgi:hypothetical protein